MIAFTCGDPSGVGPEIIERWLHNNPSQRGGVAVLGPRSWLLSLRTRYPETSLFPVDEVAAQLRVEPGTSASPLSVPAPTALDQCSKAEPAFVPVLGSPCDAGARLAWAAMETAAAGCVSGLFEAVVTGPISKERLARVGYPFPGQTEFFAARWGGEPTMVFSGGKMRVVLLSWHIPLREVPQALTPAAFERSLAAATELARAEGIAAPRIGICGLNPHAGENGLLGREEIEVIEPILAPLRSRFPLLSKCEPSDTLFGRHLKGEFDVVVALYHDQGLAPLKVVDFDESVNITLGLPFVRTSPDHGTAFGIAGKGQASAKSFSNAVMLARKLVAARS